MFSLPFFCRALGVVFSALSALLPDSFLCAVTHSVGFGPTVYHYDRERDGNTHQSGTLVGIEGDYRGGCSWGLSWEVRAWEAWGDLHGKNGAGDPLKSQMDDREIWGTLGYSLGYCFNKGRLVVTPFAGYGDYRGKNKFRSPSPLEVTFKDRFDLIIAGGRVEWQDCSWGDWGFEGMAKWMVEGKRRIEGDPLIGDLEQIMGNATHWEWSLYCRMRPFRWFPTLFGRLFWRNRVYGEQINYPFDFRRSEISIYGVSIRAEKCF